MKLDPPIFIHGAYATSSWWNPVLRSLETISKANPPIHLVDWHSLSAAVEEIQQIATRYPRCVLVTHSLGILPALHSLTRVNVSGLILVNPVPPAGPKLPENIQEIRQLIRSQPKLQIALAMRGLQNSACTVEDVRQFEKDAESYQFWSDFDAIIDQLEFPEVKNWPPTEMIFGQEDQFVDPSDAWFSGIDGIKKTIVPAGSHYSLWDFSSQLAHIIEGYCSRRFSLLSC